MIVWWSEKRQSEGKWGVGLSERGVEVKGRARESEGRREAACICVGSVSHAWLLHTTLLLIVCALISLNSASDMQCSFCLYFFLREAWTCRELRCVIHTYAESKELQWSPLAGKISFFWSPNRLSFLFKAYHKVQWLNKKRMINFDMVIWLCSLHTEMCVVCSQMVLMWSSEEYRRTLYTLSANMLQSERFEELQGHKLFLWCIMFCCLLCSVVLQCVYVIIGYKPVRETLIFIA